MSSFTSNVGTDIHNRAGQVLRELGGRCMRQFAPDKDSVIDDEFFELWIVNERAVIAHFYSKNQGVEFYVNGADHTWGETRKWLQEQTAGKQVLA